MHDDTIDGEAADLDHDGAADLGHEGAAYVHEVGETLREGDNLEPQ